MIGATGRMGTAIVRACAAEGAARDRRRDCLVGQQVAGPRRRRARGYARSWAFACSANCRRISRGAQVAIDFSRPDLSLRALNVCRAARVPIVIGTTGHGAEFEARVAGAARDIAVLVAPNTSLGVAVAQGAGAHRGAGAAAQTSTSRSSKPITSTRWTRRRARRLRWPTARPRRAASTRTPIPSPAGPGRPQRRAGEIGIASIRAGDIVGTHTVLFAGTGRAPDHRPRGHRSVRLRSRGHPCGGLACSAKTRPVLHGERTWIKNNRLEAVFEFRPLELSRPISLRNGQEVSWTPRGSLRKIAA